MVIIPAYPMVVLGCRVECPELQLTEEGAVEVLEDLVSPHFIARLQYERYLCEAIGVPHFKRAWKKAPNWYKTAPPAYYTGKACGWERSEWLHFAMFGNPEPMIEALRGALAKKGD